MTSAPVTCDLNCDLGEDPESLETDRELLTIITSANIACGGHAGDERSMHTIAALARDKNVAIGAHPSYPDRANFGRTTLSISPEDLARSLRDQITTLRDTCRALHVDLMHIKPHGALYHDASRDPHIAAAIARAALDAAPSALLIAQARSPAAARWRSLGLTVIEEAFADRAYAADGSLLPRSHPAALITDPALAASQALHLIRTLNPGTLCIHADTPGSPGIARAVAAILRSSSIRIAPPRQPSPRF
ncbi:MAG TPA: LamB/YcsF family protein [Phycisphaerales bacterium]|nr:LamB/YcsF family protein [Phycisphaerales bacterium]